jgi:uncharacterized protein (DUF3084 family)
VLVDQRLAGLAPLGLDIGDGDAADVGQLQHGSQIVRATRPDTDDAQQDLVAGRDRSVAAKHAGRYDRGQRSGGRRRRGAHQKFTTRSGCGLVHERLSLKMVDRDFIF